jgi:HAD superfamily hydrolase (TIGR01509 family)
MKAVIFDMDGVIIDSQPIADTLLFNSAKEQGVSLKAEEIKHLRGASLHDFWDYIKSTYHLPLSVETYESFYAVDKEIAAYKNMQPISGIRELIDDLLAHNVILGLATSASQKRMNAVLNLFNMQKIFTSKTAVDEVSKAKPNPQIYLTTAHKLNVSPLDCLVIEDSPWGLQAAKNAGMKCVFYNKTNNMPERDIIAADLVINDFHEIDYGVLETL